MSSDIPSQDLTQNRQGQLIATAVVIVSLALLFILLRFYSRWIKGVKYGMDDWMLVLSMFSLFGLLGIGLLMIHFGLGVHQGALDPEQIVNVLKGLLAFECIYVTTVAVIKISLLLMYCRAFDVHSLRVSAVILGAIVVAWAIAIILVCIFQCTPIPRAWNTNVEGTCINLRGSFIGNAVPNILTDIAILGLPIRQVWKLNTEWRVRIQLLVVFSLGSFVIFTSIYRFTTLFDFVTTDTTWTLSPSCIWCIVECASGIISVCLPTLSPLLQQIMCIPVRKASKANSSPESGHTDSKDTITSRSQTQSNADRGFERIDSNEHELTPIPDQRLNATNRNAPVDEYLVKHWVREEIDLVVQEGSSTRVRE